MFQPTDYQALPPERAGFSDVRLRPAYFLLGLVTLGFAPHIGFLAAFGLGMVVFASTVYLWVVRRPLPHDTVEKLYREIAQRDAEARRLNRPLKPRLQQVAQGEQTHWQGSLKQRSKIAFSQKQG